MTNYREILRLSSLQYSQRTIESMAHCSRHTVRDVLQAAKEQGISWPLSDDVANADLEQLLFPNRHKASSQYAEPDYPYIHRELARSGVTLTLLWEEYCAKCQEAGKRPYMSTQFGERYRRWARITKATMRIQHKPGDAMQVDWAGDTIPIQDPVTGEQSAAYLFVAVLPCSYYTYAEHISRSYMGYLICHHSGSLPCRYVGIPTAVVSGLTLNMAFQSTSLIGFPRYISPPCGLPPRRPPRR